MMHEIISKKTGKIQIVSDEVWDNIIARGWDKKYNHVVLPERKLKDVPIIPAEVKTKTTKKVQSNG